MVQQRTEAQAGVVQQRTEAQAGVVQQCTETQAGVIQQRTEAQAGMVRDGFQLESRSLFFLKLLKSEQIGINTYLRWIEL